jgi:anion-transporting  ArsA/GET3 family ATPase
VIGALEDRRLVVCAGAGGVGKTTVSAAVALRLAQEGHRTAVVTIDPARRLATALGLAGLGDEPHRVSLGALAGPASGELWALHLDAKATFDRLVARHAPDARARERILENRIYRHLSGAVAGAQEYMAVERLHELVDEGSFDRIVLDTPPAQNALDFLDAPQRITRFIEGRALRLLLRPALIGGGIGRRVLHVGSHTVISILERLAGAQLLRDVAEFLAAFDGMYQGFADRARVVREMLLSPASGFVIVAAPQADPLHQAVALARRLEHDGFPLVGVVLNRVHPLPPGGLARPAALSAALARAGAADPAGLAARVASTQREAQVLGIRDLDAREALARAMAGAAMATVPALAREPVDLEGLARVAGALGARDGAGSMIRP